MKSSYKVASKLLKYSNIAHPLYCYKHDDRIHWLYSKASEGD